MCEPCLHFASTKTSYNIHNQSTPKKNTRVRNPDYLAAVNNNACEAERAGAYSFSRRCYCVKSRFIAAIQWGKGKKKRHQ